DEKFANESTRNLYVSDFTAGGRVQLTLKRVHAQMIKLGDKFVKFGEYLFLKHGITSVGQHITERIGHSP
ncbi:MAG TPA: hypothetical protein VGF13_03480, partial [Verrucomicrobiae bacterium]